MKELDFNIDREQLFSEAGMIVSSVASDKFEGEMSLYDRIRLTSQDRPFFETETERAIQEITGEFNDFPITVEESSIKVSVPDWFVDSLQPAIAEDMNLYIEHSFLQAWMHRKSMDEEKNMALKKEEAMARLRTNFYKKRMATKKTDWPQIK